MWVFLSKWKKIEIKKAGREINPGRLFYYFFFFQITRAVDDRKTPSRADFHGVESPVFGRVSEAFFTSVVFKLDGFVVFLSGKGWSMFVFFV